jgi:hypothetical protein
MPERGRERQKRPTKGRIRGRCFDSCWVVRDRVRCPADRRRRTLRRGSLSRQTSAGVFFRTSHLLLTIRRKTTAAPSASRAAEIFSLDRLPESSLAAVEEHMPVCDQCRARLDEIELGIRTLHRRWVSLREDHKANDGQGDGRQC